VYNYSSGHFYNDGELYGWYGLPTWVEGRFGSALSFQGHMDYVTGSASDAIHPYNAFTIEAWVYPTGRSSHSGILEVGKIWTGSVDCGIALRLTQEGYLALSVVNRDTGKSKTIVSGAVVPLNEWTHVAGTYDGSSGRMAVYIKGELDTEYVGTDVPSSLDDYKPGFRIGAIDDWRLNEKVLYKGKIDEVYLYGRAFTDAEIRERYNWWPIPLSSATAYDSSNQGAGIQAGDQVVITFDGATEGTPIDASNINTALALSDGHSWLDGSGNIGSAVWSSRRFANDTLTITLSDTASAPTVAVGDIITLGGTIRDVLGRGIAGSVSIKGSFEVPSGAVAYWKCDEGSGTIVYDSTDNHNDGTLKNGTGWTNGKSGYALWFDGSNDYVEVADSGSLQFGTGSFSVEVWLYARSFSSNDNPDYVRWMSKVNWGSDWQTNPSRTWWTAQFFSDGSVSFGWRGYGDPEVTVIRTPANVVTLNTWYHVVVVVDRDNGMGYIYVNGVERTEGVDISGSIGSLDVVGKPLQFGGTWAEFPGMIDEILIYNRALTSSEVLKRYNIYGS